MKTKEILTNLAKKAISVSATETSRKVNTTKYIKFSYWNTYVSVEYGKNFDYLVLPGQDAGSLTHFTVKFEKLTEEEVAFILENWSAFGIVYITGNFQESMKGVNFDSYEHGQQILINENASNDFNWMY
jgi:hypothetical protein